jgi:anti-sigma B factor antagonist
MASNYAGDSVSPNLFDVEVEWRPTALYLRLVGELDLAAMDEFEDAIRQIELQGSDQVVIDLRRLDFIDSSGLGAIIDVWRRSSEDGVNVAVLQGPGQIQRAFEVTGLDRVVACEDTGPRWFDR